MTPIVNNVKTQLEEVINKMAEKGLRTIVLAYREIDGVNVDLAAKN